MTPVFSLQVKFLYKLSSFLQAQKLYLCTPGTHPDKGDVLLCVNLASKHMRTTLTSSLASLFGLKETQQI